ncbi:MAG TPA: hypothetical protein PKZ69_06230 [Candidatus Cloacimonadota bacterium]|nr:hypothetical protein [Candidatus Cloacimonadota bacterium]HOQ80246.1 hypothetical protein [Candidatus Cloacimonadota bacterium]HPK41203.1 hypothetical protein [Candidatus Cloacimonadota bacterium]
MTIIIAYLIISTPILAIIFFIFYKSYLAIKELSTKKKLSTNLVSKYQTNTGHASTVEASYQTIPDNDEDEITAVISAAVSYYYANN